MILNINSDASVIYTNKLEKLHKSALPVAIRGALNDTAFTMKMDTMPKYAKSIFTQRSPNFWKANSRVNKAEGFDIKTMVSTVGFVSSGLHNSTTNYSVKDLEQQEHGGVIKGRSFKPLPGARISNSGLKNVRANNRIASIKDLVNSADSRGVNDKQKFIKASVHAGVGGYVLGGKVLWRVTSISRVKGNIIFKREKLFSFQEQGVAKINKATHFMQKSALIVRPMMEEFYAKQAIRQIKKLQSQ